MENMPDYYMDINFDYGDEYAEFAGYGTCKNCKTENVLIGNHTSPIGSYTGLCEKCGREEQAKNLKKYFEELEGK